MKKQTEKHMSIGSFARIMCLNEDAIAILRSRISYRVKHGDIERKVKDRIFRYKESDLLLELERMQLNTSEQIPADCISIHDYFKAHPQYKSESSRIASSLSKAAKAGSVKRYYKNGRVANHLYHVKDIERLLVKKNNRNTAPLKTPSKPGIFVRLWRWLFGYNN